MRDPVRLEFDGGVAVVVIDNPPVNAGSAPVRRGLLEAVQAIDGDTTIVAAVLIGAGGRFMSGSDLREFGKALQPPELPAVISAIEASHKPFVAALAGASLGGGYELALACDLRIADVSACVGLPEVTLGVIPGAGGTQRLPRLVGQTKAISLICSGTRVSAAEAQKLGMVDGVVSGDLRTAAVEAARALSGKRRVAQLAVPAEAAAVIDAAASAALRDGIRRPAIDAAIAAVRNAARLPFEAALRAERAVFQELRMSPEAAALRYLFFAERELARRANKQAPEAHATSGIIGTRVYAAFRRQCEFLVEDGVLAERVDTVLENFGFSTGPFATRDPLTRDAAARSSGHVLAKRNEHATHDDRVITTRVLAMMVNEAALLLQEGLAERASDIDVECVRGHGFPRHEGGPVYWAARQHSELLDDALDQIAAAGGPVFTRGPVDQLLREFDAASSHV